jgi:hypothetical protein
VLANNGHAACCLSCAFLLQAFGDAERLVDGSITFVQAAKNALLDLDAWRLAQGSAGKLWKRQQQQQAADDTAESCDRWAISCSLFMHLEAPCIPCWQITRGLQETAKPYLMLRQMLCPHSVSRQCVLAVGCVSVSCLLVAICLPAFLLPDTYRFPLQDEGVVPFLVVFGATTAQWCPCVCLPAA